MAEPALAAWICQTPQTQFQVWHEGFGTRSRRERNCRRSHQAFGGELVRFSYCLYLSDIRHRRINAILSANHFDTRREFFWAQNPRMVELILQSLCILFSSAHISLHSLHPMLWSFSNGRGKIICKDSIYIGCDRRRTLYLAASILVALNFKAMLLSRFWRSSTASPTMALEDRACQSTHAKISANQSLSNDQWTPMGSDARTRVLQLEEASSTESTGEVYSKS